MVSAPGLENPGARSHNFEEYLVQLPTQAGSRVDVKMRVCTTAEASFLCYQPYGSIRQSDTHSSFPLCCQCRLSYSGTQ